MDKYCFQQSLCVVNCVTCRGDAKEKKKKHLRKHSYFVFKIIFNSLCCFAQCGGSCIAIEKPRALIHPQVNKQWTGILSEEDS